METGNSLMYSGDSKPGEPSSLGRGVIYKAMVGIEYQNKGLVSYLVGMHDHSPHPHALRDRELREGLEEREKYITEGSVGL